MPARARAPNAGGTVRTIKIGDATANARQWYGFSVKLKRGACEWCVCATDLAGKPQANGGKAAFTVE